jgi:uncharacterized protein YkwD
VALAMAISVLNISAAVSSRAVQAPTSGAGTVTAAGIDGTTLSLASSSGGRYRFKHSERCFMRKINNIRARHGLGRLRWDKQLGVVGRKHARKMARTASGIWHDDIGSKVTRWNSLGQNTGMGGGCKRMTRAFMHSPSHRSNYLGSWRHVGVGVAKYNGSTYVQQVFESRRDPGNIWHRP